MHLVNISLPSLESILSGGAVVVVWNRMLMGEATGQGRAAMQLILWKPVKKHVIQWAMRRGAQGFCLELYEWESCFPSAETRRSCRLKKAEKMCSIWAERRRRRRRWLCSSSSSFSFREVLFHSCHFRSFISWGQPKLTVLSPPHQHSYQWEWRQHCLQLGGSRGREGWSRGPGVYTIKLRWPWCWKHSPSCTFKEPLRCEPSTRDRVLVFILVLMLLKGWGRKRGGRVCFLKKRTRIEVFMVLILAFPACCEIDHFPSPPVGLQVSGTRSRSVEPDQTGGPLNVNNISFNSYICLSFKEKMRGALLFYIFF